jgi:DNA-binding LytR/AlgR family response regulator
MRDYRRIHTPGKRIMTLQTFREFEQQIPPQIICRVHKSYMVSISRIESVERDRIRIGEQYIPISESYKAAFYGLIGR